MQALLGVQTESLRPEDMTQAWMPAGELVLVVVSTPPAKKQPPRMCLQSHNMQIERRVIPRRVAVSGVPPHVARLATAALNPLAEDSRNIRCETVSCNLRPLA